MLDRQRQRYAPHESSGAILFTRKLLFVHFVSGMVVLALLLFHELFAIACWAAAWFVLTLMVAVGMTKTVPGSRVLMAFLFLAAAGGGFFITIWMMPTLKDAEAPLLPLSYLPFWLVAASLGYAGGAYALFLSNRIKRACRKGFTLLDTPKPL